MIKEEKIYTCTKCGLVTDVKITECKSEKCNPPSKKTFEVEEKHVINDEVIYNG